MLSGPPPTDVCESGRGGLPSAAAGVASAAERWVREFTSRAARAARAASEARDD